MEVDYIKTEILPPNSLELTSKSNEDGVIRVSTNIYLYF